MGHAHDHPHHDHAPANFGRAFAIGIGLNIAFVLAEWLIGLRAGSLALVADAGHNLSDVLGLILAWTAFALAKRRPCGTFTYGLGRTSILAALGNGLLLLLAIGALGWEAIKRLQAPQPIETGLVMGVAALGIVINGATALLFMKGREHDLNVRGAFLHMAMDALVSLGVVVAGAVVAWTGWHWLDPAVSLGIGLLILWGTWELIRDAMRLILDGVPASVDLEEVQRLLRADPRVKDLHDLHVWAMSTTSIALSAHVVVDQDLAPDSFLAELAEELEHHCGITHSTIQLEHGDPSNHCLVRCSDVWSSAPE